MIVVAICFDAGNGDWKYLQDILNIERTILSAIARIILLRFNFKSLIPNNFKTFIIISIIDQLFQISLVSFSSFLIIIRKHTLSSIFLNLEYSINNLLSQSSSNET